MSPLLAMPGLTHLAAFSWRISWTGRSKLAPLLSLEVGTGCHLRHLSSPPSLILQQTRWVSLYGSWLQNSHNASSITFHESKQVTRAAQIQGERKSISYIIGGAAKMVWPIFNLSHKRRTRFSRGKIIRSWS